MQSQPYVKQITSFRAKDYGSNVIVIANCYTSKFKSVKHLDLNGLFKLAVTTSIIILRVRKMYYSHSKPLHFEDTSHEAALS